jgi:hypothetical protein
VFSHKLLDCKWIRQLSSKNCLMRRQRLFAAPAPRCCLPNRRSARRFSKRLAVQIHIHLDVYGRIITRRSRRSYSTRYTYVVLRYGLPPGQRALSQIYSTLFTFMLFFPAPAITIPAMTLGSLYSYLSVGIISHHFSKRLWVYFLTFRV